MFVCILCVFVSCNVFFFNMFVYFFCFFCFVCLILVVVGFNIFVFFQKGTSFLFMWIIFTFNFIKQCVMINVIC